MKSEIKRDNQNKKSVDKRIEKLMPSDYEIIDIVLQGKRILVNMRELIEIANCENKMEIISAQNKAATYYFYFGRVQIELQDCLDKMNEEFEIWMSEMKGKFSDEKSETAKVNKVMAKYSEKYQETKDAIRNLQKACSQAEIAKKTLEKSILMLQSIGATMRESSKLSHDGSNVLE